MNKTTFVIISVSDRINDLNALLRSIMKFRKFDNYDVNLIYQDYLGNAKQIENLHRFKNVFIVPNKLGCHAARVRLLQLIEKENYEVFINLDDDMELLEQTNYGKAITKAKENTTGFVLTNWARNRKLAEIKIGKMKDAFVKQVFVYNGGGMVYSEKIAKLMRELPMLKATFDNAWSLTAYVKGYTNFRYLGSVAVHRVCGVGGMKTFMAENNTELTMGEYINYRTVKNSKGRSQDYCIPLDTDLKAIAHEHHKLNARNL